jgi:putative transposase
MTLSIVEQYDTPTDVDGEIAALAGRIAGDGPRLPLAPAVADEAAAKEAARRAVADLVDRQTLDAVLAQPRATGCG